MPCCTGVAPPIAGVTVSAEAAKRSMRIIFAALHFPFLEPICLESVMPTKNDRGIAR